MHVCSALAQGCVTRFMLCVCVCKDGSARTRCRVATGVRSRKDVTGCSGCLKQSADTLVLLCMSRVLRLSILLICALRWCSVGRVGWLGRCLQ